MSRYLKTNKPPVNGFTVVMDDREKQPWEFLSNIWRVERKRLKTGDYSIVGYEDKIAIEKKSGIGEILMDLTARKRPAFERFLKRMSKYPVKCILVEEELTNDNIYKALAVMQEKSKGKGRLTAESIYYWLDVITVEYGIPVVWADKYTIQAILPNIFQMSYRKVRRLEENELA